MGRRAAPQPLALKSDSALRSDGRDDRDDLPTAETTTTTTTISTTTTSPGVSPGHSRSPRSPRSPFHSRFSSLRSQASRQKASPVAAVTPATVAAARDQPSPHEPVDHTPDEDSPSLYSSISSALEPSQPATGPPPATTTVASPSTPSSQAEARKGTKNGFFHFSKPSKSFGPSQPHVQHHHRKDTESRNQMMSRGTDGRSRPKHGDPSYSEHSLHKPTSADPLRSDISVSSAGEYDAASPQSSKKGSKPKPFGRIHRTKSDRDKEGIKPGLKPIPVPAHTRAHTHAHTHAHAQTHGYNNEPEVYLNSIPLRTAPVGPDRSFRDMMSSAVRNRSEDRAPARDSSATREHHRENQSRTQPSSLRENGGSNFLSGLRSSSTRAADIFSKGFFGKSGRSGGASERESGIDDEHYQLKVINLPLVEQARLTRISTRLEDSRDKTEFWMPAFPWRAIDYLNYKGCEVEGLYRVPGSGPQIKKWQRKFDEQYDVNLFEEHELYDINIIGSMLKAWLRELPDELFPKAAQDRIARECAGAEEVPDLLIEELSNLSPFNYYLLFAITCHLSLLLAHSDKNKMDFRNLCICFQPCMKIDAFCFKFLVCDWRDCWKGCKNEGRYIEEEYTLFDQPPPRGLAEPQMPKAQESDNERQQLSSSDSSKRSGLGPADHKAPPRNKTAPRHKAPADHKAPTDYKAPKKNLQLSPSNGSVASNNPSLPNTLTLNNDLEPGRRSGDIRPLSPIKPLSPLGF
ncbi:hypothetical protein BGZ61DRAFT_338380 [Ilyonectria robusta]|uniref:uncharacterized protein n=1 Tax=Ilyonectria robusta TaxID=1079257 RepID=UPI001E8D7F58|nr:uncharacterized protein BGZ61DRAFT_338380 [Ilyonectria robusta]KAH8737551.1 hypothetical protein BGZ61DRAFT_338380 [Ilyonectria robusta]